MNVGHLQASRPQYYDRNPAPASTPYGGANLAPHGLTERLSITVAAGKKAWFDVAYLQIVRTAVSAGNNSVNCYVAYRPNGGTEGTVAQAYSTTNVQWEGTDAQLTGLGLMAAGDRLRGMTADGSPGGTVSYTITVKYTTFDA